MILKSVGSCIQRSRDTLTNLVLGMCCLRFWELVELVEHFSHDSGGGGGLKILHINLLSLNPQVFDLLAEKFGGLASLDIKYNSLLSRAEDEMVDNQEPQEQVIILIQTD